MKREEWQKERNAKAKEIVTTLQSQLLSVSKLHKKKINDVGKKMYLDVKRKIALAAKTDKAKYRYDTYGRLEEARDADDNILQKYNYNYKTN